MTQNNHGRTLGQRIGGTIDAAVGSIGEIGRRVGATVVHAGLRRRGRPGMAPGIEAHPDINTPPQAGEVHIQCFEYSPQQVRDRQLSIDELPGLLAGPASNDATIRWLNIDGLNPWVIRQVQQAFGFHSLAAEDVLHTHQRPKVEPYEGQLFVIARMLRLINENELLAEQVSCFLADRLLVTFQETHGDVFEPIRQRIRSDGSKLRQNGADFLLYALIDAMVDHGFPLLEHYGEVMEQLEQEALDAPQEDLLSRIHAARRELAVLRRVMWPMRQVVSDLQQEHLQFIQPTTRTYLRDVHEHAVQLVDVVESYREVANSLTDLYMSMVGQRTNEIMKVLTIMASIFIPITFLAGVYGMNFDVLPELHWRFGYVLFWIVCLGTVGALLGYFWHRGWIGRR